MIPSDLPSDMPSFLSRFGTDAQCRAYLFEARWPHGFSCCACDHGAAYAHKRRLIYECARCGKQHSLLAGTIFEQTKTGLARWFLAIFLVTSSKRGLSAAELKRQMGFKSDQTAWAWLHKIRRAMVRPNREPLIAPAQADETYIGASKPGKRGRGAAGKALVVGAVECRRVPLIDKKTGCRKTVRQLGRVRLATVAAASAKNLKGFLSDNIAKPGRVTTDGAKAYHGLEKAGFEHEPVALSLTGAEGLERMSASILCSATSSAGCLEHTTADKAKSIRPDISTNMPSASTGAWQNQSATASRASSRSPSKPVLHPTGSSSGEKCPT